MGHSGDRDISIVQFGAPDQKPPASLRENCGHRGQSLTSEVFGLGAELEDVLPRAVARHEVAPGPGPEDVQHADVLSAVLRQVL